MIYREIRVFFLNHRRRKRERHFAAQVPAGQPPHGKKCAAHRRQVTPSGACVCRMALRQLGGTQKLLVCRRLLCQARPEVWKILWLRGAMRTRRGANACGRPIGELSCFARLVGAVFEVCVGKRTIFSFHSAASEGYRRWKKSCTTCSYPLLVRHVGRSLGRRVAPGPPIQC